MSPLVIRKHRQDIFARFPVTFPHQEVTLLSQQLLSLSSRNSTVIPLLLRQGALRRRDDVKELLHSEIKHTLCHVQKNAAILKWSSIILELHLLIYSKMLTLGESKHQVARCLKNASWNEVTTGSEIFITKLTDVEEPNMVLGDRIIPARECRSVSKRELFSFALSWTSAHTHKRHTHSPRGGLRWISIKQL